MTTMIYVPGHHMAYGMSHGLCHHLQRTFPFVSRASLLFLGCAGHMVENGGVYGHYTCSGISQIRRAKVLVLVELGSEFGAERIAGANTLRWKLRQTSGLCHGLGILNQAGEGQSRYGGESGHLTRAGGKTKERWRGSEKWNCGKNVGVGGHEVRGVGWLPI